MEDIESQLSVTWSQVKLPLGGLEYIQLSWWLSVPGGNPQRTMADTKRKGCSLVKDDTHRTH